MKVAGQCPGEYMEYAIYDFDKSREREIVDEVRDAFRDLENPFGGNRFTRCSSTVGYVSATQYGIRVMVKKDSGFEDRVDRAIQRLNPE